MTESERLARERGLAILGGGKGYALLGINGFEETWLDLAHSDASKLVRQEESGTYLVMGYEDNPLASWPVWAVIRGQ